MVKWYKKAIFYEVALKSFYDGNNDGMGDFRGLIKKLNYIKSLGIDCIWILPFYPSPWRDDGYDVTDYYSIHPKLGTIQDFDKFINKCHELNIRVIIDLVLNHTSDQHPWFNEARKSKNSPKRHYYVWSDTDQKYKGVRIIFKDNEKSNWTFDPQTEQYYWHRFYYHQPDLNYDSSEVQEEMLKVIEFWLDKGVDGLRIDAAPYLFEREGTSCESLPETHDYLKKIRRFIDNKYGINNRILLVEANQLASETLPYFGDGSDEIHMAFHFPLMPRLFLALAKRDARSIIEIINQTLDIPSDCQWCTFLRNHDELSLEMVSEDDREFLWDFYAPSKSMRLNLGIRRRLAPLLDNDMRKIKLMNSLLFSLPGTPIIYYGDEIGMGDNIQLPDRNGVRTPMQWSSKKNAGFSTVDEDQLFIPVISKGPYSYENININKQRSDPNSLLNFMIRLIALRKKYEALAVGNIDFLNTNHEGVLAFIRSYNKQMILVVTNFYDNEVVVTFQSELLKNRKIKEIFTNKEKNIPDNNHLTFNLKPFEFTWWEVLN